MHKVKVIASTTRPGRKSISVANWIMEIVQQDRAIDAALLDLAEINLPFLDEPNIPQTMQYEHEHTKQWSATIDESDAFIIVLAEYNFGFPAPIKNALDYLYQEWKYKPVALVSYGGIAGGLRSAQMLKQVVTALGMMPIVETVSIPFFGKYINDEEKFLPRESVTRSAHVMLAELKRWSNALKSIRSQISQA